MAEYDYDVVIVGAGIAGAIVAKELSDAGASVLILESGPELSPNSRASYLKTFYETTTKTPESPYPPKPEDASGGMINPADVATPNATTAQTFSSNLVGAWQSEIKGDGFIYDPKVSYLLQKGPHPFLSTNERLTGGTTWHWLGTSLRNLANDFSMQSTYGDCDGVTIPDWPLSAEDLSADYGRAEHEIGVAADAAAQATVLGSVGVVYTDGYSYPMRALDVSYLDQTIDAALEAARGEGGALNFPGFEGLEVAVTQTPAGRNSQPYAARRVCAGNTNCIPICPIQAKYDATVTLKKVANNPGAVLKTQAVVTRLSAASYGDVVDQVTYVEWTGEATAPTRGPETTVRGRVVVMAAHAIESAKILLMSGLRDTGGLQVANSSGQVGRNLMDHPLYLSWALMAQPVWGYRGPLSTSGIETLRDGPFRKNRAAWRVEIGNEGWNFPIADPYTTTQDFIDGSNHSRLNPAGSVLYGDALTHTLNDLLTRQWRMAFLVEQDPDPDNRVSIDVTNGLTDGLGLPRPVIHYDLSDYAKRGIASAEIFARNIYATLGAQAYTHNASSVTATNPDTGFSAGVKNPVWFENPCPEDFEALPDTLKDPAICCDGQAVPSGFVYYGSGHIVGTLCMGSAARTSVVNDRGQSWDHANLFIVGSSVFPTVATANPTLTIAALCFRTAEAIKGYLATS